MYTLCLYENQHCYYSIYSLVQFKTQKVTIALTGGWHFGTLPWVLSVWFAQSVLYCIWTKRCIIRIQDHILNLRNILWKCTQNGFLKSGREPEGALGCQVFYSLILSPYLLDITNCKGQLLKVDLIINCVCQIVYLDNGCRESCGLDFWDLEPLG